MTKKDYIKIAKVLYNTKPKKHPPTSNAKLQWDTIVIEIGLALAEDNERFSEVRFKKACGYYE